MRANLIARPGAGRLFSGILGYEHTVVPQIENALLARHDFILLGLRGQAKSRILRQLVSLLDPYVPEVEGCEIHDDPLQPLCRRCRRMAEELGDDLPIAWLASAGRYHEKLATPDVTIADLIGDIDPIKASRDRLGLGDEEALHFGIVPRTHRGIFALNELPDLQPRIQVGLLDILEEKDFQIRGIPVRLPIDVLMVFSANPEDYTNRGNIITPLKDRIASQILTHYPPTLEVAQRITDQEAWTERGIAFRMPAWYRDLIEQVAFEARSSEFVDQNSGVSARLAIAAYENLVSNLERRALLTGEEPVRPRIVDLQALVPAVSGKIELVYEGEQQGAMNVARALLGRGIKALFAQRFPDAYKPRRNRGAAAAAAAAPTSDEPAAASEYRPILEWFAGGNHVEISDDIPQEAYMRRLSGVRGLDKVAVKYLEPQTAEEVAVAMELVLEGLHQNSILSRERTDGATTAYKDMLKSMLSGLGGD